jgi:hypothetical protein
LGRDGNIHACYVAKGKHKGALRVVTSASSCKRRRGERPLSWSLSGPTGAPGQGSAGERGANGAQGPDGSEGFQGPAGQLEKSVVETIQTQSKEINGLTQQVTGLTQEVTSLEGVITTVEGTLATACTQLSDTTAQVDTLQGALGNLSLNSLLLGLGGGLNIPILPAPLGAFSCP